MSVIKRLSDASRPGSLAHRFRHARFAFFSELLERVEPPIRLLDIGGTESFWRSMDFVGKSGIDITICNLETEPRPSGGALRFVPADACDLHMFSDSEFDVVFSNSVIEHVGDMSRCRAMASEVQRVGKRYFVQTPNRNFPIDPHFPFPFFQFMPIGIRAKLVQYLPLAWVGRIRDPIDARAVAQSVRLLTSAELAALFPGCELYRERVLGLNKSFIAYSGWSR